MSLDEFFVTGDPLIFASQIAIGLTMVGLIALITYLKRWKWLWSEWFTTVDHKKIGIMYILSGVLMFFRGGVDGLLMKAQTSRPELGLLDAQHYDEIFTTHGVIMILFMAMPMLIGIMNVVVPLQIGARDVAFPKLNAFSFWIFFAGAMLFNLSFVIGGSPDAGWTSYFPLAGKEFTPGVGNNYYALSLQIAGIGTLATGINFVVTIIKMRAPGLSWMKLPIFTWSTFITSIIIVAAFPILTIALLYMTLDRLFGTHFFTVAAGGDPMLWLNLFWLWGHPEVYIVVLPAFGMFSEVIATFARKNLYGYKSMVYAVAGIAFLSMLVWVHHFYTMGNSAAVNSIFSLTTMMIAIPTGVKIFNWLFTLRKGRIEFSTAMLWSLAFIPCFTIGGVTGVMLAMAAADYQYHNTMFLVAHFHYVLIPGVVFAVFAALYYWWPKMFGFKLNEKIGKWHFWLFVIGFNMTFMPMFFVGLDGMSRRMYTYAESTGWGAWLGFSAVGSLVMAAGFAALCYNIYWSFRYASRDVGNDPWNARTLEWATASPAPHYNFAVVPEVETLDDFWYKKKKGKTGLKKADLKPVHMPSNSWTPIVLAAAFGLVGFFLVFEWFPLAIISAIGIVVGLVANTFDYDDGYHIPVEELEEEEREWRGDLQ
ncbi:cytochrome aa3 quinol oxidase subunit I [Gracilibacillus lacisalsi]|uniref:cytochrome aa3 quinol oxidase subunit I n=1 Tax=Gracilibacillus lacisalsi TaxID=393087 RepID=UPI000361BF90|nr:cytochrome aa3 quinol oxidase subunit I [Gracilibacillus lacisalsi]